MALGFCWEWRRLFLAKNEATTSILANNTVKKNWLAAFLYHLFIATRQSF